MGTRAFSGEVIPKTNEVIGQKDVNQEIFIWRVKEEMEASMKKISPTLSSRQVCTNCVVPIEQK